MGAGIAGAAPTPSVVSAAPAPAALAALRARKPQDEVIYFLLPDRFENGDPANDRGGMTGDRSITGFDPTSSGFFHGGDLAGIVKRLDYIQGLGATAIWVAPVFKNKVVQGPPEHQTAGYHGYWITDFTRVDPHFGTNAEFKQLVDAAHARGLKVYMDIVVNHTADVIQYKECPSGPCPYRSRADYPYQTRGGVNGPRINAGFIGDGPDGRTTANFAKLTDPDYAYTPYVPKGEEHLKVPDWLNSPIYYHNRGDTTFKNESATMGDFGGLDDVFTENPRVVQGFIKIFGDWIDQFGVDGFRIDTARHVDPGFWQAFVPAMLSRAKADGIPNFHIFGEVSSDAMNPGYLAQYTQVDHLPAVLDFAFRRAVLDVVAGTSGPDELATLFAGDALYRGGAAAAMRLPTFVSNHDNGRFAYFIRKAFPGISDAEALKRVELGYAMMMTLRGVPTIYYGDEQGFTGDGGDRDAREDMFPSKVASYNDNVLLGTKATTAQSNFDPQAPLYRAIATLAHLRTGHKALTEGAQIIRDYDDRPGLFAVSRIDPATGREIVVAFNTSAKPLDRNIEVSTRSTSFASLHGRCPTAPAAPGSLRLKIAPLDYVVCAAD
ncbi:MAG: alpha-amylase family glycosyl hydrolase [Sphingomonas sp.]